MWVIRSRQWEANETGAGAEEEEEETSANTRHLLINAHECHFAFSLMRIPACVQPRDFNRNPPVEFLLQISARTTNEETPGKHPNLHEEMPNATMAGFHLDNKVIKRRFRPLICFFLIFFIA